MSIYPRLLASVTSINNLFVLSLSQVLENEQTHQLCFHQRRCIVKRGKKQYLKNKLAQFWESCLSSERRRGSCLLKLKTSPLCSHIWPRRIFLTSQSKMRLIRIFRLSFFTTFQKLDGNTDTQVSWIGDISSFYSMVCSHSDSFSKMSNTTASSGLKPVWGNINVQIQHFHSLCSTLKAGSQANFLSILQSPPSSIRHHTCTTPFLFLRQLLRLFLRLSFVQGFLIAWSFR